LRVEEKKGKDVDRRKMINLMRSSTGFFSSSEVKYRNDYKMNITVISLEIIQGTSFDLSHSDDLFSHSGIKQ
jgi:hypothetical protein